MALNKTTVNLNFSQGLDQKSDNKQVQIGKFLQLENTVFDKGGKLQKRNGFNNLTTLPDSSYTNVTTYNGNLTAIGTSLSAFSASTNKWSNKGDITHASLSIMSLINNNASLSSGDSIISSNNLVCSAYFYQIIPNSFYKYTITDAITGQNIVPPTTLDTGTSSSSNSAPRVFYVNNYFIIIYTYVSGGTDTLRYISISSIDPTIVTSPQDIGTYVSSANLSWDAVEANNSLYIAFNSTTGGQSMKITMLDTNRIAAGTAPVSPIVYAGEKAEYVSLTADLSGSLPVIWTTYWTATGTLLKTFAVSGNLSPILAPTLISNTIAALTNLTSSANNSTLTVFYQSFLTYVYNATRTDPTNAVTVTSTGTVGTPYVVVRGAALASKAKLVNDTIYLLVNFTGTNQPTYFLIDATNSIETAPVIITKIAYQEGAGGVFLLPAISNLDDTLYVSYLLKTLIQPVNKGTNVAAGNQTASIYAQVGLNLAKVKLTDEHFNTVETSNNLFMSGGFLWQYDGHTLVENGFFLYPSNVKVTTATGSGSIAADTYYYIATYEWSDNQGNIYRSAPSVPVSIVTTTASSTNTINVPTLRLTYKTVNPVKIVLYRWAVAQQAYYQVTSITIPILNSMTVDYVTITDDQANSTILGNNLLYTTGGVIENISSPATNLLTIFDTRVWLVDAENPRNLWFSKQILPETPVEMSDLLTFYVAPSTNIQTTTGPITAMTAMDDKLILFTPNAIYYINGAGPDNTGAQNQYSQPIFVTSVVGCDNQKSLVLTPNGLMFQSNKGIWLLDRQMNTSYIGAPADDFNLIEVVSAQAIPETNQVRFSLESGITLMYDYYYNQWGTFKGAPNISSCIYNGLHTIINAQGKILQETPGSYIDGSRPVLISFQTSWFNLAGLQGYERFYFMYLLGSYYTPFKLNVGFSYDYKESITQQVVVSPDNFAEFYGDEANWGSGAPWGGTAESDIFEARVFPTIQKCESFRMTVSEVYDRSYGIPPGQGLSLSGLAVTVGTKKDYRVQKSGRSFG